MRKANDVLERAHCRARFLDLVMFLEKQAKILMDPLFGDIQDIPSSKSLVKPKAPVDLKELRFKSRESSFATIVAPNREAETKSKAVMSSKAEEIPAKNKPFQMKNKPSIPTEAVPKECIFCEGKHAFTECEELEAQSRDKKFEFLVMVNT